MRAQTTAPTAARPRDPQSFTSGDRRAVWVVTGAACLATVAAIVAFVAIVVAPAL